MKTQLSTEHVASNIVLTDVVISGKQYRVKIANRNEHLIIEFDEEAKSAFSWMNDSFHISIGDFIRMSRLASRPNHDHDDTQDLYIVRGEDPVKWISGTPNSGVILGEYKIPFGSVELSY